MQNLNDQAISGGKYLVRLILLKFEYGRVPAAHLHLGGVAAAVAAAAGQSHLVAELAAAVLGGVLPAAVPVHLAAPG